MEGIELKVTQRRTRQTPSMAPSEIMQSGSNHSSAGAKTIHGLVLLIVWAISISYMGMHLKRGWVPHDEGTLGQSAERVLHGQLPHRDFDDYTGGLTFAHALAFREFGINSASMRVVLFIFFVPWVPAVFYVASRFGSAYSAAAVTLLAVAWSVPNYPGPMPSWYNLYFAVFGLAALLRYVEVGTRRWLVVAGICGGISLLVKITAAYFVAGVLLSFLFREQSIAQMKNGRSVAGAKSYSAVVVLGLGFFLLLLFRMVHKISGSGGLIYFVLPAAGLIALLVAREFSGIGGQNQERFGTLLGMCLPFGAGIAIPVLFFVTLYLYRGGFYDLAHGILTAPEKAMRFASGAAESPITMVSMSPFIAPVLIGSELGKLGRAICGCILALFVSVILIYSATIPALYQFGWYSMKVAIPVLVLAGAAILWVAGVQRKLALLKQQQIMLVVSVTALCSLVQFPFEAPVYFFFAAPLLILTATALFSSTVNPPRLVLGVLAGFYLLFAVLRVAPTFMDHLGLGFLPDVQVERLTLPRAGGLRVDRDAARMYQQLIPLVQSHVEGKFIYAAPDCPEVYFLSGLQSPTRYYFDFADNPVGHTERILYLLENFRVNVVAIRKIPQFSGPLPPDLRSALELLYPYSEDVGLFQVRWKH